MTKLDSAPSNAGRKRQLNLIYFIDASRTHTITVSLGQLRVMIAFCVGLIVWSIASIALVASLLSDRANLLSRLHVALNTVFDYETRVDNVFDLAYPQPKASRPPVAQVEVKPVTASPAEPSLPPPPEAQFESKPEHNQESIAASDSAGSASIADAGAAKTKSNDIPDSTEDAVVSISRPVLLTHPTSLELRFDLTTRSGVDLAEGFIFAIAEFTTDQGERQFIGAPRDIAVSESGIPKLPLKATSFAIKRFKQKGFKFPIRANISGTFTKLHIAVIGTKGNPISAYDLPVQLRIGKHGWEKNAQSGGTSKSG
jgi:hypothetical protein